MTDYGRDIPNLPFAALVGRQGAEEILIGSAADCGIVVDDQYASDYHAVIRQEGPDTYYLYDLASTNGTWARRSNGAGLSNRQKVHGRWKLAAGDIIVIGRTEIPWRNEA